MTSLRERRPVWIWLSVSVGLHAAVLGALVFSLGARPRERPSEAGGSGILRVELVGAASVGGTALRRAPALRQAPGPRRSGTPQAPPRKRVTAAAAEHAVPASAQPARVPTPEVQAPAPEPIPDEAPAVAGATAEAGADAGDAEAAAAPPPVAAGPSGGGSGPLSRVARPAGEIRPRYPEAARARGDEAEVIVEAWVAASGRVERAWVRSSAGPEFDGAALEAVRRARFHPAWRDGEAVDSRVAMRLHFELER